MIDQALQILGVDPAAVTDVNGWRIIGLGTAMGLINLIQLDFGEYCLVVWSPLLHLPADPRLQLRLFETLLRLNHHETGLARFALQDDLVVLSVVRPIHGLILDEVLEAIRTVLAIADQVDEQLRELFAVELPAIPLDSQAWQVAYEVLRLCAPRTQHLFNLLLEKWVAHKGQVTAGQNNLALVGKTSGKTVAALIGYASAGPLVTVSWDALEKQGLLAKDIQAFKQAVPRPAGFKVTASSAHLPVDESFTAAMVEQLVTALSALDKAFQRAVPPPAAPLPDLKAKWGLDLAVGKATIRNIDTVLTACPEPAQPAYSHLIQGWAAAGHPVYTNYSPLVYLRVMTEEHTFALCVLKAPQKGQAALIDISYSLGAYYKPGGEPRRYEQELTQIAGAVAHGTVIRIPLTDAFTVQEADKLLQVLLQLAADSQATPE